jgi:hypothetical protein
VIANGGAPDEIIARARPVDLANMTAALEYVCRKLPPERDNQAIRKYIAEEIIVASGKGQTSLGDLTSVGLNIVNDYLFPPGRSWLKALRG